MSAQDYPITFPFGAKTAPYSPSHPHRGDDREMPMRTPIYIGGVLVAYSGNSGSYLGQTYLPHLHIQEWLDDPSYCRKPQHAFYPGQVVQVSNNPNQEWGRYFSIVADDGWWTTYCHLDQINVTLGQVIKGDDMDEQARQSIEGLTNTVTAMAEDQKNLAKMVETQGTYITGITNTVLALAQDLKSKGVDLDLSQYEVKLVKK
jgi:hypothetical protein